MESMKINLGETQQCVLKVMDDLEWRSAKEVWKKLKHQSGVTDAVERLARRGILERRAARTTPRHYEYRLNMKGLGIYLLINT